MFWRGFRPHIREEVLERSPALAIYDAARAIIRIGVVASALHPKPRLIFRRSAQAMRPAPSGNPGLGQTPARSATVRDNVAFIYGRLAALASVFPSPKFLTAASRGLDLAENRDQTVNRANFKDARHA